MGGVQQVQLQGGHSSIISMQLCQLRLMSVKNGGGGPWWPRLCLVAVAVRVVGGWLGSSCSPFHPQVNVLARGIHLGAGSGR